MAYTQKSFIEKSNLIYKNKYNYSKVIYKGWNRKVKIICPIHGEFEQTPNQHLYSNTGCYECGRIMCASNKKKNAGLQFIEKANTIHKNKYNYSLVEYISARFPIKIICPIHGEFEQVPYYHLSGNGCSKCKASIGERKIQNYLINNNIEFISQYSPNGVGQKRFDFYIPNKNLIIEYDGIQHFKPIRFSYSITIEESIESFKQQQIRDKEKELWCLKNCVKLLRIKYTQVNNIERILDETF